MFAQKRTSESKSLVYLLPKHTDFVLRHVRASDAASLQEICFTDYDLSLVKDLISRVERLHYRRRGTGMVIVQRSTQKIVGVLGVIGPTRLNYGRIVPMVDYTARVVGRLLS